MKSLQHLLDIYYASVGLNAVLLLNVPPDQRGLIHENDAARLKELGAILRRTCRDNLARGATATASHTRGQPGFEASRIVDGDLEIQLPERRRFNRAMLQEQIREGQRIESCAVDAWLSGAWKELARGTTVGHKRLFRFETVETDRARLRILESRVAPTLSNFGLFFEP